MVWPDLPELRVGHSKYTSIKKAKSFIRLNVSKAQFLFAKRYGIVVNLLQTQGFQKM